MKSAVWSVLVAMITVTGCGGQDALSPSATKWASLMSLDVTHTGLNDAVATVHTHDDAVELVSVGVQDPTYGSRVDPNAATPMTVNPDPKTGSSYSVTSTGVSIHSVTVPLRVTVGVSATYYGRAFDITQPLSVQDGFDARPEYRPILMDR